MSSLALVLLCMGFADSVPEAPQYKAEQIFAPIEKQTHAPGLVELANGDLLASWYGDAEDADAAVLGARKLKGEIAWSASFVMADRRGFPDCNTCMMIDRGAKLWLFLADNCRRQLGILPHELSRRDKLPARRSTEAWVRAN